MRNKCFRKKIICFLLLIWIGFTLDKVWAITRFSQFSLEKKIPIEFSLEDFWLVEKGEKVIADISLNWITVVFNFSPPSENNFSGESTGTYEFFIAEKAQELINRYPDLINYLYDKNLAEDACFFNLRAGMTLPQLKQLIIDLNQEEVIYFVHPALILNNKTYAFFNVLRIQWKSSVDLIRRNRILEQTHVTFDELENIYRVDLFEIPFFTALHLLEEDVNVIEATPYLVEIRPSITASLKLTMNGANIGEPIPFALILRFSDRVNIDPSSVSNIVLRPANLQRELFEVNFDPYDPAEIVRRSPIKITGKITGFAPGEFILPPVNINYTCLECSDDEPRSISTQPVPFKVSSIVPSGKEVNRLLVPLDPVLPNYSFTQIKNAKKKTLTAALICLIIFLTVLVYLIRSFYQERKKQGELIERSKEEVLREKLLLLLSTSPIIPHWEYMADLGRLLREYLGARFSLTTEELSGGSGKRFIELIGNHFDPKFRESLFNLFELIDNTVALELTAYPEIEKFRTDLIRLLNLSSS